MKIRTEMDLQDAIDSEMAWRKKELSALKSTVNTARSFAKNTALRSGIALLYAHWEGSIKNMAIYYLEYVYSKKIPYNQLKINFLANAIKYDLTIFDDTNKSTKYITILDKAFAVSNERCRLPSETIIKTASNLNSEILVEIISAIGLDIKEFESSFHLIDDILLKMRNEIAHGERIEILSLDEDRYYEIHDKIVGLIDRFSIQIVNAVVLKEYLIERT